MLVVRGLVSKVVVEEEVKYELLFGRELVPEPYISGWSVFGNISAVVVNVSLPIAIVDRISSDDQIEISSAGWMLL